MTVRIYHQGTQYPEETVRHIWMNHHAQSWAPDEAKLTFDQALQPSGEDARDILLEYGIEVIFE